MKKSQIIVKMINKGESEIVEFKNNFDNETIETLVSFANTKGGKIFIGVTDGGQITGVKIGNETIQQWINEIKTKTQPSLIPDIEIIELFGKHVAVFDIQEYPVKPVSFKGRYYKRIKNSNHLISIEEVVNLHLKTFNTSWDYYIDTTHSIKDISLKKIAFGDDLFSFPPVSFCFALLNKSETKRGAYIGKYKILSYTVKKLINLLI